MKFRLEFVQSFAGSNDHMAVVHSIQDRDGARKVIDMRVSPDAYESGTFAREPRRLAITLFIDEWIRDHLLSGEHEYERFISHYTLAVYRDETLFFTGIIDTSAINYTQSDQIVTITAYTPDRLLALFSDLEAQYSLSSGYTVQQLFALHISQIRQRVGVPINYNTAWFERPELIIDINDKLVVAEIDVADMEYLPPNGFGYTYSLADPWGPRWGWYLEAYTQVPIFLVVQIVTKVALGTEGTVIASMYRLRARVTRLFNNICGDIEEYDANTGWVLAENQEEQKKLAINELDQWLRAHGTTYASVAGSPGLPHQYQFDDHGYSYDFEVGPNKKRVAGTFYGRVLPQRFHPGTAVMEATSEQTNCLDVLKAVLYATHSTITSDASGALYLRAIPLPQVSGELVTIPARDISEMTISREDYESPGEGILDVFAGDTELMEEQLEAWHDVLRAGRWKGEFLVTRPERYSLALGQAFLANGAHWMVISIEPQLADDTIRIRAWKVLL